MLNISKRTLTFKKGLPQCKSNLTNADDEVSKELLTSLHNRFNYFNSTCKTYESCLWIESNENLLIQKGKQNITKYYPKQIVFADLGIDTFGHEFSYEHPCIVIYNLYDRVFVVPCTSQPARRDKNNNLYGDELEGLISDGFAKTTTILIKEAKFIDKTRIKSVLGNVGNVLYNNLFNELFNMLFESKKYQIKKLIEKDRVNTEKLDIILKEKETLEKELHIIKQRYELLTDLIESNGIKLEKVKIAVDE